MTKEGATFKDLEFIDKSIADRMAQMWTNVSGALL